MPKNLQLQRSCLPFEIKAGSFQEQKDAASGVEYGYFEGYASVFGNKDLVDDVVERGAFSDSLATKKKYPLYWNHSMMKMVGSIMESAEDMNGLYVKGRINLGTHVGRDTYALLKGGDISAMSIGYQVKECEYDANIRRIQKVNLIEISLVSDPANPMAQVTSVKSLDAISQAENITAIEDILVDSGLSRNESKALISQIKKLSASRDGSEGNGNADPRDADKQEAETKCWKETFEALQTLKTKL